MSHDKYNIRGIVQTRTNRKDDIFMQRRMYIDEAHTALDIFRFAAFFLTDLRDTSPIIMLRKCLSRRIGTFLMFVAEEQVNTVILYNIIQSVLFI